MRGRYIQKHQIAFPPSMSGDFALCFLSVGWGGPNERLLNYLGEWPELQGGRRAGLTRGETRRSAELRGQLWKPGAETNRASWNEGRLRISENLCQANLDLKEGPTKPS